MYNKYFLFSLLLFLIILIPKIHSQEKTKIDTTLPLILLDSLYFEIDDVVITGTRVKKKIIDIPYSVYRLKGRNYQFDRKIGIDEVLTSVPGVFMQSRYGNHDVRIAIRGFGSRSNSGIRGVRILLDDIPESEPDGQTRIEAIDFNSVGSIELVKGNSSSLYTNAPGGVVNFINDIDFQRSSVINFNQFGSFGLRRNGFKAAIRTENYGLLTTYSYHNYTGFREHNNEYWHILNTVLETTPGDNSSLKILGYFVDGELQLPGSLTKEEFIEDPLQPDQRQVDRDSRRKSVKGRIGIRFNSSLGSSLKDEIEITAYGTIKYFHRPARTYRIINRNGLGTDIKYINKTSFWNRQNEFIIGTDLLLQPATIENYDNINGQKGDQLNTLVAENISNTGFYLSNNFEILNDKLFILLTGRYDDITYDLQDQLLGSRSDIRTFNAFTPKVALNYKLTPHIALYTSYGASFDSPAKNELESFDPSRLLNQELEAQESKNFEIGIKGNLVNFDSEFLSRMIFEATYFNINIDNEIVPWEVFGDVFFRNAANTLRQGIEVGTDLNVFKGLNLNIAYTFSDFKYKTYSAKTIEIDTTGNIVEAENNFSGNVVPSVPKHNIYFALSYNAVISNQFTGFLKTSLRTVSGLWVDDANSDKTDGYSILNMVAGIDLLFGNFNIMVSAGVNNLLDKLYVGFTNTNSADKRFYEAGEPRNYFGSINLGYVF